MNNNVTDTDVYNLWQLLAYFKDIIPAFASTRLGNLWHTSRSRMKMYMKHSVKHYIVMLDHTVQDPKISITTTTTAAAAAAAATTTILLLLLLLLFRHCMKYFRQR